MILPYWPCRGCDFAPIISLTDSIDICSTATDLEYQMGALTIQEISLKHKLSLFGQAISINALNKWETRVNESLADLQVALKN